LDEAVEQAIKLDTHVSKSDLIRDAVREKLERMGFGNLLKPRPIES
jgi:Arc/MetJ-type ribon-helix-helix transcriptional regulator